MSGAFEAGAFEIVVATRNAGKLREFEQLLAPLDIRVRAISEFPDAVDPEETGATFEENAVLKARAAAAASDRWALADDSGLCVDALGGAPGIHSARYAPGDDAARRRKLLDALSGVDAGTERTAAFVCVLALVSPDGAETHVATGRSPGRIARQERGSGGFGYDPVFLVEGDPAGRTMAELSSDEKHAISHRGRAFVTMLPKLREVASASARG